MPSAEFNRSGVRIPRAGFTRRGIRLAREVQPAAATMSFGGRLEKLFSVFGPRPRYTADILSLSPAAWWDFSDFSTIQFDGVGFNGASGGIQQIQDKSGNGKTLISGLTSPFIAAAKAPIPNPFWGINELPAMVCGTGSFLRTADAVPFSFEELYCVVRWPTTASLPSPLEFDGQRLINPFAYPSAGLSAEWFVTEALGGTGLGTPHPVYINGDSSTDRSDDLLPAIVAPCVLRMASSTGVLTTTAQINVGGMPPFGGGAIVNGWNGKVGEIVMFPTTLSERDRMYVETYLSIKWGIGMINRAPREPFVTTSHLPEITGSTVVRPPAVPLTLGIPAVQVLTAALVEVPTTSLTLTAIRPGETDPEFANVSLLLPLTTADGFTDLSANGFTMSVFGSAAIVTSDSDFPEGALDLNGSSQYLRTPADAAFAFGTGPFTIEGFIKPDVVSGNDGLFTTGDDDSGAMVALFGGNILWSLTGSGGGTGGAISAGVRRHIALTRDSSSDVRLFLGGTQLDTTINSTVNLTDNQLSLGYYFTSSFLFDGRVNWFRVTKGVARYTSNFTPPSIPFPDS